MTMPAPIGHNNPPSETEIVALKLDEGTKDLTERQKKLIEALERLPAKIDGAESAQKITTYAAQIQDCISKLEDERVARKRPYDDLAKIVHNFFKTRQDELSGAISKVKALLKSYDDEQRVLRQKEENDRRAAEVAAAAEKAEAAKKLADEAAALEQAGMTQAAEKTLEQAAQVEAAAFQQAAAASAPTAPVRSITRGAGGGSASSRGKWEIKITDLEKLDVVQLLPFLDRAALDKALRGWKTLKTKQLKEGDTPPVLQGAEVYWDTAIAIRR